MAAQDVENARTIKAVDTALDIVDALCELSGATVTELGEHLGLSTSGVHTHLKTLERRGYVIRDGYSYRPSLRFFGIGEQVKREHILIYNAGREEIKKLAEDTGEFGWIMAEERGQGIYVYKCRGSDAVETGNFLPGRPIPLHSTACGKAILAHLPESQVEELIDVAGLEPVTNNTITDQEELRAELDQVRERGYALSSEESVHGIRAAAAPVLTADGAVMGSVSISGPVSRIKGERFRETLPELLIECSNIIEIRAMSESSRFRH